MNTYYKAIKLKNGELMACISDADLTMRTVKERSVVEVRSPVVFNSHKFMDSAGELVETISMMPLMPITESDVIEISTDHIFSVAEMRPVAAERYVQFLEHLDNVRHQEDQDIINEIEAADEDEPDDTPDNVVELNKFTNSKLVH